MNYFLAITAALLPLAFWWRFRNVPLDRDYAPYAYCGVFNTGFLEDGHVDIKGPIIQWSYRVWLILLSPLKLPLSHKLRLMPAASTSSAILIVGLNYGPMNALVLAILFCSPTLWTHMANTEWLTVSLISLCVPLATAPQMSMFAWIILGLLPWVNQKNLLLIVPVAWALGLNLMPTFPTALAIAAPSIAILCYITATRKLNLWRYWLIRVPAMMGAKRTFRHNTVSALKILTPCLALFAPVVASLNIQSPWIFCAGAVVVLMILSKQIVPHHFILLVLPVALSTEPSVFTFAGIALIWCFRDGLIWYKPELVYQLTFPSYGSLLEGARTIENWIKANTKPDEIIWVNGYENQIYLNTMRKAWRIEIPELEGLPEGEPPKYVVHSAQTAKKFDYEKYGYETELISNMGHYTLVVRK